jgi:signal peptidase II
MTYTTPSSERQSGDKRPLLLIIAALVVLFDRLSKLWIVHHVRPGYAITVIPGVFRITHVLNTGAAFSLFADSLSPLSIIAVIIVLVMLWRTGRAITLTGFALALILGGAVGNLYDRLRLSFVIDFLEVRIVHYHWPDFNVADSCIVIGACLLIIEIFRPQPTEN